MFLFVCIVSSCDDNSGADDGDIRNFPKVFEMSSALPPVVVALDELISELTLDERSVRRQGLADFCDRLLSRLQLSSLPALDARVLRGRSVGPTFNADFRKSLFAHFEPFDEFDADEFDDGIVFVGDSFGTGGGRALAPFAFCFGGLCCFGPSAADGLFVFDFSDRPLDTAELERDGDFDTEVSLDLDGDVVFSRLLSDEFRSLLLL